MSDSRAVAIIGMSCSFAGSPDIDSFWQSIHEGRVHFRDVPADRWDHSRFFSTNTREPDMTYARKVAHLDDLRSFSPERYGLPPRRAYPMDPQQRLMLDQARLALDDAGYGGRPLPKSTGVYVGASVSEYKDLVISRLRARQIMDGQWGGDPEISDDVAKDTMRDVAPLQQYSMVGVLLNMIACSISEAFDLQGPALVMDAACSSALLALHEAVLHLREKICDAAIVGGVYSICTPDMMVAFSRIGALSRSDACRPFDAGADGFVLGEGAGAVVLKRLEDAQRDGDRIWAIVRGVGLNNDGRGEGPMTPRLSGQVDALARAYRDAGLSPDSIGYIEAHGTATPVGDATEISAIRENARVHGKPVKSCAITSVKGNIGHTLAAAGVAGLIKSVLVLNRGIIPPQAGLTAASERLGLEGSGFYVPTAPRPFERTSDLPRRAAINAFGFGGTNVHVILEEPPPRPSNFETASSPQLFMISASKPALLREHLTALKSAIENSSASLIDLAHTLTATRRQESAKVAFVASSRHELFDKLQAASAAVDGAITDCVVFASRPATRQEQLDAVASLRAAADALRESIGFKELLDGADSVLSGTNGHSVHIPAQLSRARRHDVTFLENIGRLAVLGVPFDFSALYPGARTTSLPSAPLPTRRFWIAERKTGSEATDTRKNHAQPIENGLAASGSQKSVPAQEATNGSAPAGSAPSMEKKPYPGGAAAVRARVLELIAKVSAYPLEDLKLESKFGDDLGFDSLLAMDLFLSLTEAFPETQALPESAISGETTVGQLVDSVAALVHASPETGGDGAEASPQVAAPVESPHNGVSHSADDPDSSKWRIEEFPEIKAMGQRIEQAKRSGFGDPYFSVHEQVTNDTSIIGGHEYVNFASYNYLGLSGDPEVTAAAVAAVERYGTSVSASRLASGEKPLHRELELGIADFLGCEDAIVMVGGHATNVSVIGHLFGPQDLVIHDSLAHDSILGGIRLSGAKRRPFPHNDVGALEQILRQSRGSARRVLIAVEGVYSMDGDVPPLAEIVEIKRRHNALLLVDEAHSLGVLGATGRGVGEHCGIQRDDVELWMGTLSKALASCGGYIAGSAELVRYLKYSNPGFVYSVGISPANAAAALAALHKLESHPELVATLRDRCHLFLELSRAHGINTGLSQGSAVVPCIVGNSMDCMRLASELGKRRINVQPILYPAVEESLTRLRFFLTARHKEQQIRDTVAAVAEELEKINPQCLKGRLKNANGDEVSSFPGRQGNAAVS